MSREKKIIIKVENVPEIGETIVDETLRPVGKVFDIFGPINSPYASFKPTSHQPQKLLNKTVYILPKKRLKRK
jgi:rRNA processing protein Gar1